MSTTVDADAIVVGAGIAGASVAYFMAPQARVIVLEREPHPASIPPAARPRCSWRATARRRCAR